MKTMSSLYAIDFSKWKEYQEGTAENQPPHSDNSLPEINEL